jgi:hypothetical protein
MATMSGSGISRLKNFKLKMMQNRRTFMKSAALAAAAMSAGPLVHGKQVADKPFLAMGEEDELFFKISLAQWSLNSKFRGRNKEMENLDFPAYAKEKFDIHAVEYVDQFFPSADKEYIKELLKRSEDAGVRNVLIMVDTAGALGDLDEEKRVAAVEKHYQWVEAAEMLGCHAIRVNAWRRIRSGRGPCHHQKPDYPLPLRGRLRDQCDHRKSRGTLFQTAMADFGDPQYGHGQLRGTARFRQFHHQPQDGREL